MPTTEAAASWFLKPVGVLFVTSTSSSIVSGPTSTTSAGGMFAQRSRWRDADGRSVAAAVSVECWSADETDATDIVISTCFSITPKVQCRWPDAEWDAGYVTTYERSSVSFYGTLRAVKRRRPPLPSSSCIDGEELTASAAESET